MSNIMAKARSSLSFSCETIPQYQFVMLNGVLLATPFNTILLYDLFDNLEL